MTTTYQLPAIGATLTIAELKALPKCSIVVDPDGDAMQKRELASYGCEWHGAGYYTAHFNDRDLEGSTLLWIPETREQGA